MDVKQIVQLLGRYELSCTSTEELQGHALFSHFIMKSAFKRVGLFSPWLYNPLLRKEPNLTTSFSIDFCSRLTGFDIFVPISTNKCDQIGPFIGLWASF